MSEHLGANLKLLCSHYRSISEVCRQLAINRAQFNKYLSGQSQPTPYNRKRIGDFFGVEDYELGLPPEQFARLIGARTSAQPRQPSNDPLLRLLQPLRAEAGDLGRYCGYYFEYANCMSVPGSILLSWCISTRRTACSSSSARNARSAPAVPTCRRKWARCRYLGAAFQLQDRVFLIDYESLTLNEMSQTILIPSFKSRITRLNGLKMGVSSGDRRTPACSRVVWEYLGAEINRINAYRQVRLYRPDDPRIDEDIRQRLAAGACGMGCWRRSEGRGSRRAVRPADDPVRGHEKAPCPTGKG